MSQASDSVSASDTPDLPVHTETTPEAVDQAAALDVQQSTDSADLATDQQPTLTVREVLHASWTAYRNNLAPILVVVIGTLAATAACGTLLTGSFNEWYWTLRMKADPNDHYMIYACFAVLITGDVFAKMLLANGARNIFAGRKVKLSGFFRGCLWYSGYFTGMVSCFILWMVLWEGGLLVQLSLPDWDAVGPANLSVFTLPVFLPGFVAWLGFYCVAASLHSLAARFALPIAQHEDLGPFQTLLKSAVLFVRTFNVSGIIATVFHVIPLVLTTAVILMLSSGNLNAFTYSFIVAVPSVQFFISCPLMILACTYIYRKVELQS